MFQACSGCDSRFAVGFLRCPRCQAVAPLFAGRVKEEAVPKATVNSGASNEAAGRLELRVEVGDELVELPSDASVVPAADYASMPHAALKDEARNRGLPAGGSKAALAQRLNDHDAVQGAEPQEVTS